MAETAVTLLRVSSKKQMAGEGIPNQREGVTVYCSQKGYGIAKEFVIAESAELTNELRVSMTEALDWCVKNKQKVSVVVIWKVDRFSRAGLAEYYALKAILERQGIRMESATERIDATASGEMMEGMLAIAARFENRMRVDRTISAERRLTSEGYWCRPAPTGFVNAKKTTGTDVNGRKMERPILKPTEDAKQWSLLCYGFRKQMTGCFKISEVVRDLQEKGLMTRAGNSINAAAWTKMCRSPVYGGLLCEKWTGNQLIPAQFSGAITPDEWHQLQRVMNSQGKLLLKLPRQKQNRLFPLRRFLRCSHCDAPLGGSESTGKMKKKYGYYDCKSCGFRVASDPANTLYQRNLERVTPEDELITLFSAIVSDSWDEEVKRLKAERDNPRQNISAIEKKQRDLLSLMQQCADEPTIVAKLKGEYKAAEKEITTATSPQETPELLKYDRDEVLAYCRYYLKNSSELWHESPVDHKNRYQRMTFPDGVRYASLQAKRTPEISHVYREIDRIRCAKTTMAARSLRVTNSVIGIMIGWFNELNLVLSNRKIRWKMIIRK